jgi:endonuclease/exonuclease/phosphatase family metal-dependent hydrolase
MSPRRALALTWIAATIAIVVLNVLLPPPFGVSALPAIFEPYIVLVALIAAIAVVRSPSRPSLLLVIALIAVSLVRYLPVWVSFPQTPTAEPIRVSTWNMHFGPNAADRVLEGVSITSAQILALHELGPDAVAALEQMPDRFPYRALTSDTRFLDVGLLSEFPITETERSTSPQYVRAVVDPPASDPIVVYAVHAPLARLLTVGNVPYGVDFNVRDKAISLIRARVDADVASGLTVIVLGDFNTTERELAYQVISSGLRDSHLDAGIGPGVTWRPPPVDFLPFGMLRIDYVFSTSDLRPVSSTVDCSLPSDHCAVDVQLEPFGSPTTE